MKPRNIVSDPNSETKKQPETVFLIAFIMDSSEGIAVKNTDLIQLNLPDRY